MSEEDVGEGRWISAVVGRLRSSMSTQGFRLGDGVLAIDTGGYVINLVKHQRHGYDGGGFAFKLRNSSHQPSRKARRLNWAPAIFRWCVDLHLKSCIHAIEMKGSKDKTRRSTEIGLQGCHFVLLQAFNAEFAKI